MQPVDIARRHVRAETPALALQHRVQPRFAVGGRALQPQVLICIGTADSSTSAPLPASSTGKYISARSGRNGWWPWMPS